jgi:NADPH:quinone reductase-like Zn-dependent oxidoreductase
MVTAIVASGYGGPENLTTIQVDRPPLKQGEVRIAVRAAGINPIDYKRYSGMFGHDPAQLPMRLGIDAAGVVIEVGENAVSVTGPVSVGDEVVVARTGGTYAEEIVVAAKDVLPKPESLSWAQASGIMVAGTTAVHALALAGVQPGDTVLIHGGAGGVGHIAIQMAVARGANVIATASAGKQSVLTSLGATPVEYGPGLAERVRQLSPQVNAAVDTVGTDEAVETSLELVADRDRIATTAAFARGAADGIRMTGSMPGADPGTEIRQAARIQLIDAINNGSLDILVSATYPFDDVLTAHTQIAKGHTTGKTALLVSS